MRLAAHSNTQPQFPTSSATLAVSGVQTQQSGEQRSGDGVADEQESCEQGTRRLSADTPRTTPERNNRRYAIPVTAMTPPVVPVELPPGGAPKFPSQRPYRYGMVMLCLGALINWLGLAENYFEPVRYIGVACIVTGAMLIIAAMCCWMKTNTPTPPRSEENTIHVIDIPETDSSCSKPPDYDTAVAPPSYDTAIKLNPAELLNSTETTVISIPSTPPPTYNAITSPK